MRSTRLAVALLAAFLAGALAAVLPAEAQYFGRNKVQYDDFDFRVLRTPHFDVHYYPETQTAIEDAARMAERWYARHSRVFLREFQERKPLIFYANDADFQQTNVIGGLIGQGTGGVTESLKERVVMPLTGIYAETDHVLGHELVHSFQYDIALNGQDTTGFDLRLLPLWMVEGMAEYLSIGRYDPNTALWLRDAALREDLPTIKDLSSGAYFPYRFGQAYMAYVGGKYGDASIINLYRSAGRVGADSAFVYTLGIHPDSLSAEWQEAVREAYLPLMEGRTLPSEAGRPVITSERDGGRVNVAPSISPDGRHIAFLSERDLFNINLFVADTETGEVVKRLDVTNSNPHFDALRFISSSGAWSPDGERLAFVTFVEGDNEIAIWDVDDNEIVERIRVRGVSAMANPAWSPEGGRIAFTGLTGGVSDLYVLDLETRNVRQLTNDRFADLQPAWSPDGETIAITTDRGPDGTNFETLAYAQERLALVNTQTGNIEVIQPFGDRVTHHNPEFGPEGRSLFFISDQDGFKDVYRYDLETGQTYRITYIATGVSGITERSPAMTIADEDGTMAFSVFTDNEYEIHTLGPEALEGTPVEPRQGDNVAAAGVLPPFEPLSEGLVGSALYDPLTGLPTNPDYDVRDYTPRLTLDYVAPPSVGVSAGGTYGGGVSGGVGFLFSDMLGNQSLQAVVMANGTLKDIGGQVAYANMGNRYNWGGAAAHIPIRYGGGYYVTRDEEGRQVLRRNLLRVYYDNVAGSVSYPLSVTRRLEASTGFTRVGYELDVETIDARGRRDVDDAPDAIAAQYPTLYYYSVEGAFVGDFSNFGFVSPLQGGRYRFSVAPFIGVNGGQRESFVQVVADYRRYFFKKPFTFAVRGLHIGNYGADAEEDPNIGSSFQRQFVFSRNYLGDAYRFGFVRGYGFRSFDDEECIENGRDVCDQFFSTRLSGTRIALASAEVRLPLFGTEQLGLINFPYLPTELVAFSDGGLAWTADNPPSLAWDTEVTRTSTPVFSAGLAARVNLLGFLIGEVYYAKPFQRPDNSFRWGLVLRAGW